MQASETFSQASPALTAPEALEVTGGVGAGQTVLPSGSACHRPPLLPPATPQSGSWQSLSSLSVQPEGVFSSWLCGPEHSGVGSGRRRSTDFFLSRAVPQRS